MKVFRLDLTPEQARALADELLAMAQAGLDHPSIVRPLGAGVEGTVAYAANEYVAAESLDVALKHYAPATLEKVLPFITQLAGAIDFARTTGIGHGALHPRDVFVTPDEARATGFGVVQALEQLGIRAPVRRPYTAPERVDGGAWDVRADVYSLGAIAFELLTGRRPVGPDIGDLGSTAGAHADAIAEAISRALAADAAQRYSSALAFAAALEEASRGERAADAMAAPLSAPQEIEVAALPIAEESIADVRRLVVDPDIDIEREADEAEIQLRDEEAFDREAEDVEPEPVPELPRILEQQPDQALAFSDAPAESAPERFSGPSPEPSLFDVERDSEIEDVVPAPEPPRVDPRPDPVAAAPQFSSYAAPLQPSESKTRGRRPRPVFLPVALTLLLGLFVGFLAGYLVGSRETPNGVGSVNSASEASSTESPAGPPAASLRQGRRESSPSRAPGAGAASTGPNRSGAASPSAGAPARIAPPPARTGPPPSTRTVPARGRLMVRSTPAGAQVFVNGRRRGTTPLAIRDLAPGSYTLRITRSGFDEQSRKVTVNGTVVREINLRLQPSRPAPPASFLGSLYVDSRPRGARVFLDGTAVGTTPMQASDIRAGAHVVRLELKDHRTWTASTRVVAGEVTRVTGSLERQQ